MNKPVYLSLSILEISKSVMYEFCNAKPCYMDTESFIARVKTNDIYKGIAEDVETRSDYSNFEIDKPLPKEKNKNVIVLMKDELGGEIMKEFFGLRAKNIAI